MTDDKANLADMVKRFGSNPTLEQRMTWAIEHPDGPVPVAFNVETNANLWLVSEDYLRKVAELRQENADYDTSFNLQWQATQRAIRMWQDAHPDRKDIWPDKAHLVVWLMEELDKAKGLGQEFFESGRAHERAIIQDKEKGAEAP